MIESLIRARVLLAQITEEAELIERLNQLILLKIDQEGKKI
jgi:hypothetical protein